MKNKETIKNKLVETPVPIDAAIKDLQKDDNLPDKCSCGGYFNEIGHEWLGEDKNGVGRSINTERCSRCNKIRQYMIGEDGSVKIVKDSTKDGGPGSSMKDIKRKKIILIQDWCECGNPDFLCYPEDDGCSCGMAKHHVHCKCGGILQVG
jgi:hypothetical protein